MLYYLGKGLLKAALLFDFLLCTVVTYLISFLPYNKFGWLTQPCFRMWCRCFARFVGVKVYAHERHLDRLPDQYIVIANHPSIFEDIGMPATVPARYLAKGDVEKWPIGGQIAKSGGTIYFDRESQGGRQGAREALKAALLAGDSVGIYVEGGCKGRRIHFPFTYGAFDLAMETKLPILPVFIEYEAQCQFEWSVQSGPGMAWAVMNARNKRANYHIHDPIYPSRFVSSEHFKKHIEGLYAEWEKKYLH